MYFFSGITFNANFHTFLSFLKSDLIIKENTLAKKREILVSTIDTKTGRQLGYCPDNIKTVKNIINTDIKTLAELDDKEGEGFVVFYPKNNLRLKIKFPEYVRLHKILTCLSVKGVWEYLKENGPDVDIRGIVEDAPDEFYIWIDTIASDLVTKYREIENICKNDFEEIQKKATKDWSRKNWAIQITQKKYPGILFTILDEREYDQLIWKLIRPKGANTFKEEI